MVTKQITKKEFIDKLTKHNSYFIGVTNQEIPEVKIRNIISAIPMQQNLPLRKAKQYSNGIKFNTGSVLDVGNNAFNKRTVYNIDSTPIYILVQKSFDTYGQMTKYMYYYVF